LISFRERNDAFAIGLTSREGMKGLVNGFESSRSIVAGAFAQAAGVHREAGRAIEGGQ
jgi:hypothetical protein